jgi:hypothetical protein
MALACENRDVGPILLDYGVNFLDVSDFFGVAPPNRSQNNTNYLK